MFESCLGVLHRARRAVWHFRQGGLAQLREHRHRQRTDSLGTWLPLDGDLPYWSIPELDPRRSLRVAVILDDFSQAALAYEWHAVSIKPDSWRRQLTRDAVDLLFVESAWAGNSGSWRYHLTGPTAPRPKLVDLVAWCQEHDIPTVFWNKEDPVHFEDFLDSARLFDWVLTTDENCLEKYRELLGHERVAVLPFAVQPALCNPVYAGPGAHERGVAFAGTYFAEKFPERRAQLEILLEAAIDSGPGCALDIYSRFLGDDPRYQFPQDYTEYVRGNLPFHRMLSAYRAYKVFLNVNTVTDSPTMCSRRLLEITACGTAVVTTPAAATARFVGTGAAVAHSVVDARQAIKELLDTDTRERLTHVGQRHLWAEHTYSHRVDHVARLVGLDRHIVAPTDVSVIMASKRPARLREVLLMLAGQSLAPQIVIATHGWSVEGGDRALARELGLDIAFMRQDLSVKLGECLNRAVDRCDGQVIAKMDDDDIYGPAYLQDLIAARNFSGADIVGKSARWVHMADRDSTVLVNGFARHKFTNFVAGPTITMSREVAREVAFQSKGRGEDTAFLQEASAVGATIYAADAFQFVQMRRGLSGDHTWFPDSAGFTQGRPSVSGLPLERIMI